MGKDPMVLGVLYTFMGWLTSREGQLKLGCMCDCTPAVQAIEEFCKDNGVKLDCKPLWEWKDKV